MLFLAPGGRTAYYGPPQLALAVLRPEPYQEVFRALSTDTPEEWKEHFLEFEPAKRYLTEPLAGYVAGTRPEAPVEPLRRQTWIRQYWMLTRRYACVLAGDRANLVTLLAADHSSGCSSSGACRPTSSGAPATQFRLVPQASLVLLVLVLGMTMMGLTRLAARDRERAPGVQARARRRAEPSAYMLSKVSVLGAIVLYQAFAYMACRPRTSAGRTTPSAGLAARGADHRGRHGRARRGLARAPLLVRSSTPSPPRSRCFHSC